MSEVDLSSLSLYMSTRHLGRDGSAVMPRRRHENIFAVLLILSAAPIAAQSCDLPPLSETHAVGGSVMLEQGDDGCALVARLTSVSPASAAVAHFRRRDIAEPLRLSFRVDLSALAAQNVLQGVRLLTAASRTAAPIADARVADIAALSIAGNFQGTSRLLIVQAACAHGAGGLCATLSPLSSDRPTIGLEIGIGASTDGNVRWWIDQPFDQPPTGELTALDNAALIGVERLVLGLA